MIKFQWVILKIIQCQNIEIRNPTSEIKLQYFIFTDYYYVKPDSNYKRTFFVFIEKKIILLQIEKNIINIYYGKSI